MKYLDSGSSSIIGTHGRPGINSGRPGLVIKDNMGVSRQNKCLSFQYFQKTSESSTHTALFHCTGPFTVTAQPLPNLMRSFSIRFQCHITSYMKPKQRSCSLHGAHYVARIFIEFFSLLKSTMTVMAKADFTFDCVCPCKRHQHKAIML